MNQIVILNLFATSAMFGIIWMVQLVHYPMFSGLDAVSFQTWHRFHSQKISYVVGPLMVAELTFGGILFWFLPTITNVIAFVITLFIWASTFFVSVPLHNELERKSGAESRDLTLVTSRLVKTNWIRTTLYSVKLVLLLGALLLRST